MVVGERRPITIELAKGVRACCACSARNYMEPKEDIYELRIGFMVCGVCKNCAERLKKALEEQDR